MKPSIEYVLSMCQILNSTAPQHHKHSGKHVSMHRGRERDRDIHIQRNRHTQRQRDTLRDTRMHTQRDRDTHTQRQRETQERQTDMHVCVHTLANMCTPTQITAQTKNPKSLNQKDTPNIMLQLSSRLSPEVCGCLLLYKVRNSDFIFSP